MNECFKSNSFSKCEYILLKKFILKAQKFIVNLVDKPDYQHRFVLFAYFVPRYIIWLALISILIFYILPWISVSQWEKLFISLARSWLYKNLVKVNYG